MGAAQVAFGTRLNALMILAPQSPQSAPLSGYNSTRKFINGQLAVVRSTYMAQTYEMIWNGNDSDLSVVRGILKGQYGAGPWLYNDPMGLYYGNMLPTNWSQPALAVGQRGNQALDWFSLPRAFGAPLSATLNNPNVQPVTLTGATNLPTTGACMWSPDSAVPTYPAVSGTRPWHQMLVPPNINVRITVWGVQNTGTTDPGVYYSLSNISATNTTIAAGTKINPTSSGATVAVASTGVWRVLDLWIGAGSATATTNYTTFGAMDVRMGAAIPAVPTAFDLGRGPLPMKFTSADVANDLVYVGNNPAMSLYKITATMSEVTQPW